MKLLKELLLSKIGFRTVQKILRNGSIRSHWKHDQRKQQVSLCLILVYQRFSVQFVTTTSQFTLSESNGLVHKPHPQFLAQNLSKKVRLIHGSLRYFFESTVLKDYAAKYSTVALYHEYPKWDQNPWFISLSKMMGSVYYDAIKPLFNQ